MLNDERCVQIVGLSKLPQNLAEMFSTKRTRTLLAAALRGTLMNDQMTLRRQNLRCEGCVVVCRDAQ
jgi:hypothetical protein